MVVGIAEQRGDITVLKGATALAALEGIPVPEEECLRDAFRMSLSHRLKADPFEEAATGHRRLDAVLARFGVGNEA